MPLKAVVMNLLSIGGAYGVVVACSSGGWLGDLLNLDRTYLVASPVPIIFFAVLFGLSMDYEVFLLSRVREAFDATGDSTESVARGMAGTGRVITSAALIMTVVFASFVADPSPLVKMLGRANWWLPRWLDRRLPHVRMESAEVQRQPEPILAGVSGHD